MNVVCPAAPSAHRRRRCRALRHRGGVGGRWHLLSASLLTVPADTAATSWPRWRHTGRVPAFARQDGTPLDPGPRFTIAPQNRIRAIRAPIRPNEWDSAVDSLASGHIDLQLTRYIADVGPTGPTVYIATEGSHPAHRVVEGLERPVEAVVAPLREIDGIPETSRPLGRFPNPAGGTTTTSREHYCLHGVETSGLVTS